MESEIPSIELILKTTKGTVVENKAIKEVFIFGGKTYVVLYDLQEFASIVEVRPDEDDKLKFYDISSEEEFINVRNYYHYLLTSNDQSRDFLS